MTTKKQTAEKGVKKIEALLEDMKNASLAHPAPVKLDCSRGDRVKLFVQNAPSLAGYEVEGTVWKTGKSLILVLDNGHETKPIHPTAIKKMEIL